MWSVTPTTIEEKLTGTGPLGSGPGGWTEGRQSGRVNPQVIPRNFQAPSGASGGRRTRWWFELLRATEHQLSVREIGFPRTAAAPAKVERWQEEVNGGRMMVGGG